MGKVTAAIIAICLLYLCAIETVQVVTLVKALDYAQEEVASRD